MRTSPLKPNLGKLQLIFYSIGVIVGAGIYSVIGSAASLAQGSLWISFVVSAGVALLTAFSYAEMTTAFPVAGAEYVYVRKAWPDADWLAFAVAMTILLGGAATAATVATAFGGYLRVFFDLPVAWTALALLAACSALNIWGLRESSWLNIVFTSIEVAGLLLVIAAGMIGDPAPLPKAEAGQPAVLAAAALLFFVYLGFEEVANLAEEVRNPSRDIPLALFVSMAVTTALYVAVAISVGALLPPAALSNSEAPLASAIASVWPRTTNLLSAIALFATANTVLITLIATSRLVFSLGRDGEISAVFSKVLTKRQTPWVAAILTFAIAALLLSIGGVKVLAEMSSFAALLAFLSVNVVLIVLRYRMPNYPRPFRVPFAIGRMPLLPVAAIVSIAVLLIHFDRTIYIAGAIALAGSAVAYLARAWIRRSSAL